MRITCLVQFYVIKESKFSFNMILGLLLIMTKNRLTIVHLEGKCPTCKTLFSTTMPEKDYELKTGIVHFCKKCSVEIDYHAVSYDEQFLDELMGQPCKICK